MADFELETLVRGEVSDEQRGYAEDRVRQAARHAPRPVLFARLTLTEHDNPSTSRPSVAKASLDVSGRQVRAHVAAPTMREAADRLESRLERLLGILSGHRETVRGETGEAEPGEWRHGDMPTHRPEHFQRPREERAVVRRKTFEPVPVAPAEAAIDMGLLDHDFHLFTNADTGKDAVLYRGDDGTLALLEAAPVETVEEAAERLDVTGAQFVFFVDRDSREPGVLYYRYDGHHGLVTHGASGPEGATAR